MRNQLVLDVLMYVALTVGMMVRLAIFQSRRVGNRRMKKLADAGKVKRVALVQVNDVGRPEYLYSRRTMKADNAQHNAELSRFLMNFLGTFTLKGEKVEWVRHCEILTGREVDQALLPDATILLTIVTRAQETKNIKLHVEWDTGSMSYAQVCDEDGRWDKYKGCQEIVLWIAHSDARREGFKARSEKVRSFMMFATAEDAIKDPFAPVWHRWEGDKWVLKRCPKPVPRPVPVQVVVQGD